MTKDQAKLFAIIAMSFNHIGYIILPDGFIRHTLAGLGNLTAVLMTCFLVDGYFYTKSKIKYGLRLLFFGLISEIPYLSAFDGKAAYLNMMFTLFLCLLTASLYDKCKNKVFLVLGLLSLFVLGRFCDWAGLPIFYTVIFMSVKKGKLQKSLGAIGCFSLFLLHKINSVNNPLYLILQCSGFILFIVWYIRFYEDTKEENMEHENRKKIKKYFFYLYYPMHLTLLCAFK